MAITNSASEWKQKQMKRDAGLAEGPRNLNGIDLLKFIFSLFVLIGHVPIFQSNASELGEAVNFWSRNYLCRVIIPFYFVCSGYFLFRKMPLDQLNADVIKNYCFKLLRLTGTWYVLLFVGGTVHLWYLGATVTAVILVSLCFYFRMNKKCIIALACALYAVGLLGDSYFGLMAALGNTGIFASLLEGYALAGATTRNGIFMGFIFVLIGALLSQRKKMLAPVPAACGFLLSMACLFIEVNLIETYTSPVDYNMYVCSLPAAYFLFSFAYSVQLRGGADLYRHLRNVGMFVYFLHLLVHKFASLAVSVLDGILGTSLQSFQFVCTLFVTLAVAVFLEWLACKKRFKWIHWTLG